ncbi:cysteine proteinase inhibitor 5-like [Durio zibethinus]|uniref:Cysteine proteinase inhibitor 5-like n=1 Tax=Durio zibethinus TaxID=66656 RepID=A0A6P5YCI5_DURZI|nr:cysteine proteinase inhibitor 5-like [Durio zibethinus]
MKQNSCFVVFLVSVTFLPLVFSAARREILAGGWQPIKNINDPHVRDVAEFAVSEYNQQSKASLKLKSVVKGEMQVVSGINYKLVVESTDDKDYEAVVWEKANGKSRSLTSFKSLLG